MTDAPNTPFRKGTGRLAADRFDVEKHFDGDAFKHNADKITVIPSLTLNGSPTTDVYAALSAIGVELGILELSGKGFITVGTGFDTYHFSDPTDPGFNANAPYDAATPAFNTYLDNLLNISDPLNVDYNPLHSRIRDGGVVLIKAGTYKFTGTVNVPPGFIIMGEGYGTRIVNQCSTPTPLFIIITDPIDTRVPDTAVDPNLFIFNRETIFLNLAIADNFFVPKFLGDTSYLAPINDDSIVPLIEMKDGTSFTCNNVKLSGRVVFSSGTIISSVTSFAIKLDTSIPSTNGTHLKMQNCFIDGFAQPISFNSVSGRNDYLEVTNCKIRSHGYLNVDGVTEEFNCIINMNDNNAAISDNEFYGNHNALVTLCYIKGIIAAPPAAGDLSNIVLSSNTFVVGKGGGFNPGNIIFVNTAGGINIVFNQYANILAHGNNAETGFDVIESGTPTDSTYKVIAASSDKIGLTSTEIDFKAPSGAINIGAVADNTIVTTNSFNTVVNAVLDITLAAGDAATITAPSVTLAAGDAATITAPSVTLNGSASINLNTTGIGPLNISAGQILTTANDIVFAPNNSFRNNAAIYVERYFPVTTTPYVVDVTNASIPDYIILVDTSTIAITIDLPVHSLGRTLIIKDAKGNSSVNNITLVRNGGTGNIDDFAGDRTISTDWVSLTLWSDGTNWLFI